VKGAPSLNGTLEMRPNLLPDIFEALLGFQLNPLVIVGDIHHAFLLFRLEDMDFTMFFWYRVTQDSEGNQSTTHEVICYRFNPLLFGFTRSPFLLSVSLRELATNHKDSFHMAAALVHSSTFVDDFAAGAEERNVVITIYYQLTALMLKISFPMGKCASNSVTFKNVWCASDLETESINQVLGVSWDTLQYTLFTDYRDVTDKARAGLTMKRQLLQATSRFYNSLGLMSPVLITGNLIFYYS
jgi:hypothetical protein